MTLVAVGIATVAYGTRPGIAVGRDRSEPKREVAS
jgi:hypothetical protein